jgi:hypothetical protein
MLFGLWKSKKEKKEEIITTGIAQIIMSCKTLVENDFTTVNRSFVLKNRVFRISLYEITDIPDKHMKFDEAYDIIVELDDSRPQKRMG